MNNLSRFTLLFLLGAAIGSALMLISLHNKLFNQVMNASLPSIEELVRDNNDR